MKQNLKQIAQALRIKGKSIRKDRPTKGAFGNQKKK
jgi:NADH/NAD ratio-sensing transcriptional regulator Rex